eukprot:g12981.t1
MLAAKEGLPVAEALMAAGADLNVRQTGTPYLTALERAIQVERRGLGPGRQQAEAAARHLLRWGADETALNNNGNTPPDLLPRDGDDGMRLLLTRAPADRAWLRHGWVVLLRLRALKEGTSEDDDDGETRPTQRHRGAVVGDGDDGSKGLRAVVNQLLGVGDGVFRTVVSFL